MHSKKRQIGKLSIIARKIIRLRSKEDTLFFYELIFAIQSYQYDISQTMIDK
jgi:hypothetical protein